MATVAVAAASLLALASATLAEAAPSKKRSVDVEFRLPGDDGVRFLFAGSDGRGPGFATVYAFKRAGAGFSSAGYVDLAGRITGKRVRARMGRIAEFDLEFVEQRRKVIPDPPECRGRTVERTGVFRGRFSFRGEGGYATSTGRRVRGRVTVRRSGGCFIRRARRAPETVLQTCRSREGAANYLVGSGFGPDETTHFSTTFELDRRLAIIRDAFAVGDDASFTPAGDLSTASVSPPAPFRGTADYEAGRLLGDLRVPFLGVRQPVDLTPARAVLQREREGGSTGCDQGRAGNRLLPSRAPPLRFGAAPSPAARSGS